MPNWAGRWSGGRWYRNKDGEPVYVIERMRNGRKPSVALRVRNETEAEAELALYTRDPENYKTKAQIASEEVVLTEDTIEHYLKYLRAKGRVTEHVANVCHYLTEWGNALNGKDLRRFTVAELRKMLSKKWTTAENPRIRALRAYANFCVYEQRLAPGNAASLLRVEKTERPAKLSPDFASYAPREVEAAYAACSVQPVRDVLCIRAKTGLHHSEIARVVKGEAVIREVRHPEIAAVVTFKHKSRYEHRQPVDAQTLTAFRRLVARGVMPSKSQMQRALTDAHKITGGRRILPGRLRHCFVTWAKKSGRRVVMESAGLPLEEIAAAVGHRSIAMTRDHYNDEDVPPMIVVPITLQHPDDAESPPRQSAESALP